MDIRITPDQDAFIREAIERGRFSRVEDAVEEALRLWEDRECRRAEILAAVDAAEASLLRGEGRRITSREGAAEVADEVKQRGQARLNRERERVR